MPEYFESLDIHIAGLIVSSYSWEHSHWCAEKSLADWLRLKNVPAMFGVDTRALTKKIRELGAVLGRIDVNTDKGLPQEIIFVDPNQRNLLE